jgi:hypothetical protein
MDCSERKFTQCNFYNLLLSEERAEREKAKQKLLTDPQKELERKEYARIRVIERYKEVQEREHEALKHE